MRSVLALLSVVVLLPGCKTPGMNAEGPADRRVTLVQAIQRADYQGDRPALRTLHHALSALSEEPETAARQRYWEGFALWRRAINGANETPQPEDLRADLEAALADFERSLEVDPRFDDANVGRISCLQFLAFIDRADPARSRASVSRFVALFKEVGPRAQDNPRYRWVRGLSDWYTPPGSTPEVVAEHVQRSMATYARGVALAREQKGRVSDPLTPSWGEPENLMSLAWCSLNTERPDPEKAEAYARQALALVPDWHYVRDILLPQIRSARASR